MKEESDLVLRTSNEISLQKSTQAINKLSQNFDDAPATWSTYEFFSWLFSYYKMFMIRLGKDLVQSIMHYVYAKPAVPDHILHLINAQKQTQIDRELHAASYKVSENSLDVHIPSYPGSPRSLHVGSGHSIDVNPAQDPALREAIEFLHQDKEFLIAAEIGNDKLLDIYIRRGTDIQQVDHLGRNALHLAVCCGNIRAIKLLLKGGVNPNIKDNLGMTALSLSLMRRPSLIVANLLFDHGAKLLPRTNPMDTGLFIQFAIMCTPTPEEENILRLLVEKGALINDENAPGRRQALHFAAMSNNINLIRLLVGLGADLYMTNHKNETPKETAHTFKCKRAYELLCKLKATEELPASSSKM